MVFGVVVRSLPGDLLTVSFKSKEPIFSKMFLFLDPSNEIFGPLYHLPSQKLEVRLIIKVITHAFFIKLHNLRYHSCL